MRKSKDRTNALNQHRVRKRRRIHGKSHGKLFKREDKNITVALVGNANVGKIVIFNELTGSNQIIGNWPGKTVGRA